MLTHNLSPGDLKLMRKWALRVYPHQVPSSPSGVTLPLMDEYHYRIMQKALSSNFEYNRSRLVGSWLMQTRAYLEQLGLIASTALYCSCALELCRLFVFVFLCCYSILMNGVFLQVSVCGRCYVVPLCISRRYRSYIVWWGGKLLLLPPFALDVELLVNKYIFAVGNGSVAAQ